MEHIRRTTTIEAPVIQAFRDTIRSVSENQAFRIVFRKKDGTVRTMDVAFDPNLAKLQTVSTESLEKRRETNRAHNNLVVRERVSANEFQWRTIPLERIMSISPCK